MNYIPTYVKALYCIAHTPIGGNMKHVASYLTTIVYSMYTHLDSVQAIHYFNNTGSALLHNYRYTRTYAIPHIEFFHNASHNMHSKQEQRYPTLCAHIANTCFFITYWKEESSLYMCNAFPYLW